MLIFSFHFRIVNSRILDAMLSACISIIILPLLVVIIWPEAIHKTKNPQCIF